MHHVIKQTMPSVQIRTANDEYARPGNEAGTVDRMTVE